MAETVLRVLVDKTSSTDVNMRHGAVLAVAEILHSLSVLAKESDCSIQDIIGKLLQLSTFYGLASPPVSFLLCLFGRLFAVTVIFNVVFFRPRTDI
jgi:hypothetical protein